MIITAVKPFVRKNLDIQYLCIVSSGKSFVLMHLLGDCFSVGKGHEIENFKM